MMIDDDVHEADVLALVRQALDLPEDEPLDLDRSLDPGWEWEQARHLVETRYDVDLPDPDTGEALDLTMAGLIARTREAVAAKRHAIGLTRPEQIREIARRAFDARLAEIDAIARAAARALTEAVP